MPNMHGNWNFSCLCFHLLDLILDISEGPLLAPLSSFFLTSPSISPPYKSVLSFYSTCFNVGRWLQWRVGWRWVSFTQVPLDRQGLKFSFLLIRVQVVRKIQGMPHPLHHQHTFCFFFFHVSLYVMRWIRGSFFSVWLHVVISVPLGCFWNIFHGMKNVEKKSLIKCPQLLNYKLLLESTTAT